MYKRPGIVLYQPGRKHLPAENKRTSYRVSATQLQARVLELSYKSLDAISWSRVLFCMAEMMPLFSAFSRMSAMTEAAWPRGSSETLFSMKACKWETLAVSQGGSGCGRTDKLKESERNLVMMRNFNGARLLRPRLSIHLDWHCRTDLNLYMMTLG